MPGPRDENRYGGGHEDGLVPLTPLDPVAATSVDQLLRGMSQTAFLPDVVTKVHNTVTEKSHRLTQPSPKTVVMPFSTVNNLGIPL